ncbi:MAG: UDP-N-acetylglucosamine 2-epimerase (non-hydrolyzing) [Deltaproteobacteria bacterium]|nr:UDP-N-acetylglucosamine 2-epimerase (non-hydrolyzing) [Deltaproteobacteria bacterium]
MNRIHLIAAARPNFMKIAPLYHALREEAWADPVVVHTGQHYDLNMSDVFFQDLGLPEPHIHLGVGSGTHAEQTGQVMMAYEKVLMGQRPDLVVVVGDVNSTMAATLAAVKLGVPTAHLEAGLRSFDRTMPEEINRVVTDALADFLWTPSPDGDENLLREGVPAERIKRVGNIMIDSLEMLRGRVEQEKAYEAYDVRAGEYGLVTLHRPANVDRDDVLGQIVSGLCEAAGKLPLVFPVHPRTWKGLDRSGLLSTLAACPGIRLSDPLGYIPFMNLVFNSRVVITDSGGIQEETTHLGIPCLTLRPNTERPVTISQGTNRLCTPGDFRERFLEAVEVGRKEITPIEFWDGHTAERVVESIRAFWQNNLGQDD